MPRRELPDPYEVKIVLDSIAPCGSRLTTFALSYPRFIHSELLTHRVLSRNSASSRAIPSEKMRALVKEHPALPIFWGKNQSGMQAREELSDARPTIDEIAKMDDIMTADTWSPREQAKYLWLEARDMMVAYSDRLAKLGLHKQLCNRLTEPWMPITVLVSATTYANWFHLRDHKDAMPEIQVIATEMYYQYLESQPQQLASGWWHLPYVSQRAPHPHTILGARRPFYRPEDVDAADELLVQRYGEPDPDDGSALCAERDELLRKVSVGRCARVSYLTHEGTRDLQKDVELFEKLVTSEPKHLSPTEHVAQALEQPERHGNFVGWRQLRKDFAGEAGPGER